MAAEANSISGRRESVSFEVAGNRIAADFYMPDRVRFPPPWPATITGPGFGGVKEMLIAGYATALAASGVACLSIDYRHWGASGGTPRQDLSPARQLEDLRAGLGELQRRDDVDPARLGAWGTSMAGGHALTLAATDPRVRAAVALIPFLRGPRPRGRGARKLRLAVLLDGLASLAGRAPQTIPVFAERDGMRAVMTSDGGWDWMRSVTAQAPNYRNMVTLRSLLRVSRYSPADVADSIAVPVRLIAAKDDSITPAEPIAAFARRLTGIRDYIEFPGSHFELFGEHLAATAGLTAEWFRDHL